MWCLGWAYWGFGYYGYAGNSAFYVVDCWRAGVGLGFTGMGAFDGFMLLGV